MSVDAELEAGSGESIATSRWLGRLHVAHGDSRQADSRRSRSRNQQHGAHGETLHIDPPRNVIDRLTPRTMNAESAAVNSRYFRTLIVPFGARGRCHLAFWRRQQTAGTLATGNDVTRRTRAGPRRPRRGPPRSCPVGCLVGGPW